MQRKMNRGEITSVVVVLGLVAWLMISQGWQTKPISQPVVTMPAPQDAAGVRSAMQSIMQVQADASIADVGEVLMAGDKWLDTPMFRVDIALRRSPIWGAGQDFNGVAIDTMRMATLAFDRIPRLERIRFLVGPQTGQDWAQVDLRRSDISPQWAAATYLQQWHQATVSVPLLYARPWLCSFESQYPTAAHPGRYEMDCK